MASGLPDFDRPPVTEVAIGVQFRALELGTPHLSLLWPIFYKEFPKLEEKPLLEPTVERFGVPAKPATPKIKLLQRPPATRLWFVSDKGDELVQVQPDRFNFNWREVEGGVYPRYENVESRFFSCFEVFTRFLSENGVPELTVEQCEVVYVNRIRTAEGIWDSHAEAAHAVRLLTTDWGPFLGEPEDQGTSARFVISEEQGPVGRLHITAEPRFFTSDSTPLVHLQLTARGAPLGEELDGVQRFLRLGREWIVKGFADVTTEEMHTHWGKR